MLKIKSFIVFLVLFIPVSLFAYNPFINPIETTVTVNTTGATYAIGSSGFLHIFAHEKVYFNLDEDGVTPNTSSKWLSSGGECFTNMEYYTNDKIGLRADSGTVTVNLTTFTYKYN